MNRIILIILTVLFAMSIVIVHAATNDTISHVFLDKEADVVVGTASVNGSTFGFSFLHDATIPINGQIWVTAVTTDTFTFTQGDYGYTAAIVTGLMYTGTLSNKHFERYEDMSECNMFDMLVSETQEHISVCINPRDEPNADNGLVTINLINNTVTQGSYTYPFTTVKHDHIVHIYTVNLPIVLAE